MCHARCWGPALLLVTAHAVLSKSDRPLSRFELPRALRTSTLLEALRRAACAAAPASTGRCCIAATGSRTQPSAESASLHFKDTARSHHASAVAHNVVSTVATSAVNL